MSEKRSTYRLGGIIVLLILIELVFWSGLLGTYFTVRKFDPSLTLHYGWIVPFLAIIPATVVLFLIGIHWRNRALRRLADAHLLPALVPRISPSSTVLKFILWRLALGFFFVALLDPKVGSKIEEVETRGIDLMVAIDVSNSMLAEDLKPNRLELAKRTVQRMINDLQGNRIGLIIFAGDAYVQLPITSDVASAKIFLDAIETNSVPTQGTAIGAAIDLCVESFDPESEAGKAIVIITDGENHEDDAVAAAERAAALGIEVHAIGAGLAGGAPIPIYNSRGQRTGFKTDNTGNTVVTALNEQALVQIVSAAGGTFVRASSSAVNLSPIEAALDKLEKGELGTASFTDHEHRFRIFAIIGLVFLLIEWWIGERSWTRKWKIS
jgi:Ca-activated chloride channel family protein